MLHRLLATMIATVALTIGFAGTASADPLVSVQVDLSEDVSLDIVVGNCFGCK